jgi:hypothetical protein
MDWLWGTRWHSRLRHCSTSRKVAGSIHDGVGIFHWHNPFGCTMALGSTQPLTEMSTRRISWGVKAAGDMADNLTTFMCRLSRNLGASTSWNPKGLSRPLMGLLYLFTLWTGCEAQGVSLGTKWLTTPLRLVVISSHCGHLPSPSHVPSCHGA